jgi:hypothetical protein
MDILWLAIASIATWRLTRMLLVEHGPFRIFIYYRTFIGRIRGLRDLASCPWCLSVWVGAAVTGTLIIPRARYLLLPFVFSAFTMWLRQAGEHV